MYQLIPLSPLPVPASLCLPISVPSSTYLSVVWIFIERGSIFFRRGYPTHTDPSYAFVTHFIFFSKFATRFILMSGMFWNEVRQLWRGGLREYLRDKWNIMDSSLIALYLASLSLLYYEYAQLKKNPPTTDRVSIFYTKFQCNKNHFLLTFFRG